MNINEQTKNKLNHSQQTHTPITDDRTDDWGRRGVSLDTADLQQGAHHVQRVLQRLGVARRAGRVRRIEGGHTEHDFVRMRIVRAAVALRRDRPIAHEAVRRAGHLRVRWVGVAG